ncbi:MAG: MATE family efflux transporter [Bacteroidales bacterium]|nr:MATE family efflux transporter [Bacteroidales bacterium]
MKYTYKDILFISIPIMMSVLVEQLINITDAIFLGHVGKVELGASAIAGMYYLMLYMLGFGFSLGLQIVIARYNGEEKHKEMGKSFFQGLWFLLLMALLLFIVSKALSPQVLKSFISSDEIFSAVMEYLKYRMYGLFFIFPALAFRSFFVGATKTSMMASNAIIMVTVNVILNWVLIFGKLGFPPLGISGAAISSSISEGVSLLLFAMYAVFRLDKQKYGFKPCFNWAILQNILQVSVWSMMHAFISIAPWLLFFISIEHLGEEQLAVSNILRSISSVLFILVTSFSTTTASLVSNLIGAGKQINVLTLCKKVIRLGYVIGAPLITLALFSYHTVVGIYTKENDLIAIAFMPYIVMLFNYFISLPSYVMLNAVSGTGATKRAFIFQVITVILYLAYLYWLNTLKGIPLAIYWTVEYLYVISLLVMSLIYMKKWQQRHKLSL